MQARNHMKQQSNQYSGGIPQQKQSPLTAQNTMDNNMDSFLSNNSSICMDQPIPKPVFKVPTLQLNFAAGMRSPDQNAKFKPPSRVQLGQQTSIQNYQSAVAPPQATNPTQLNSLLNYNSSQNCKKPLPMFALAGQVAKIDKDDETVAMPTARNYSPEEGNDSARQAIGSGRNKVAADTGGRSLRNNPGVPVSNSSGMMQTITQLAYEQSSPTEQVRLKNFSHARSTIQKQYQQQVPMLPGKHLEMTPQMETYSMIDPSFLGGQGSDVKHGRSSFKPPLPKSNQSTFDGLLITHNSLNKAPQTTNRVEQRQNLKPQRLSFDKPEERRRQNLTKIRTKSTELKHVLANIHESSPFSKNQPLPRQDSSAGLENIMDTIDRDDGLGGPGQRFLNAQLDQKLGVQSTSSSLKTATAAQQPRIEQSSQNVVVNYETKELIIPKILEESKAEEKDPLLYEKEKVFQLVLDTSVSKRASDAFAGNHRETSFDSLNTVDHLFVTGDERSSQNRVSQINRSNVSSVIATSIQDNSFIEQRLKKVGNNLNTFTLEQFQDLRGKIQRNGFSKMLEKVNQQLDDSSTSFADMPSELTLTEDNRATVNLEVPQIGTFEASKKLHEMYESPPKKSQSPNNIECLKAGTGLERQIQIYQETSDGIQKQYMHTVTCTGFNSAAPKLVFSSEKTGSEGVVDKPESGEGEEPLFIRLMTPSVLKSFATSSVMWLSCGFEHCIAVTQSGNVVSWGYGASGCLGHGNYTSYTQPKLITAGNLNTKQVVFAQCGGYHNGVVTADGHLYMWGRADVGQLGLPLTVLADDRMGKVSTVPIHLGYFQNKANSRVKQIALGEAHTLVLDDQGQVYSFGWSEFGQVGVPHLYGKTSSDFSINKLEQFDQTPCSRIAAGAISSFAVSRNTKELYAWGSQQNGQLGLGEVTSAAVAEPTLVETPTVQSLVCGDSSTIIQTEDGEVYAWGRGSSRERSVDVSRFKPKLLDSIETDHTFLIPAACSAQIVKPDYVALTSQPIVVNLDRNLLDQFQPRVSPHGHNPLESIADQPVTNAHQAQKLSVISSQSSQQQSQHTKEDIVNGDDSSILSQSLLQELEVDLQEKDFSIKHGSQMSLADTKNFRNPLNKIEAENSNSVNDTEQTYPVRQLHRTVKLEVDRIPVDFHETGSKEDNDMKYSNTNSRADGRGSVQSQIQQESESFLHTLHSSQNLADHDLSASQHNNSSQFNKRHRFDLHGPHQQPITSQFSAQSQPAVVITKHHLKHQQPLKFTLAAFKSETTAANKKDLLAKEQLLVKQHQQALSSGMSGTSIVNQQHKRNPTLGLIKSNKSLSSYKSKSKQSVISNKTGTTAGNSPTNSNKRRQVSAANFLTNNIQSVSVKSSIANFNSIRDMKQMQLTLKTQTSNENVPNNNLNTQQYKEPKMGKSQKIKRHQFNDS